MTLRGWKYSDIFKIAQLEQDCFPDEPWSFQTLATCFQSPAFRGVLAEEGGEVIGYGSITTAADSADVENIAISEFFRRCGTGTKILKELERLAKESGAEKIFLEVRVSNSAAMMMYLKNGYSGVYARTRYYADGEDCLVMSKKI